MNYLLVFILCICSYLAHGQSCKGIIKKVDKDKGTTSYVGITQPPFFKGTASRDLVLLIAYKVISKTDTVYSIEIGKVVATTPDTVSRKNVILIFDDGSQVDKAETKVGLSSLVGHPLLRSRFKLDTAEFYQLTQKTLIGVKILDENGTVNTKMANSLKLYAECMLKSM